MGIAMMHKGFSQVEQLFGTVFIASAIVTGLEFLKKYGS
jgi:hypothetical protein